MQGETQQKLDVIANEIIIKAVDHSGRLCAMASEEEPGIIQIPDNFKCGKYCLLFDPLDGSSNIDVNVPVGTIFSVVRKITRGCTRRDGGHAPAGAPAGCCGVRHLWLEHDAGLHDRTGGARLHARSTIGEFLLSHPDIRIPASRQISLGERLV